MLAISITSEPVGAVVLSSHIEVVERDYAGPGFTTEPKPRVS